ncbi:carbohydrate ABC transporter membrane protein 1, CUT1 family [Longilinea arvoryzae]|uniref:Carbohydrate ABC transporter membrane protein 1, CUT1 family n=1 Tax=Longilinea arvoryzae TaxID=360412 RepID=A0A0S7BFU3_9CHLR|nr:sugar ABC transporter permease [Longilinea arvoryzae]GAP13860.1 carbohydrate ABC transporter membrane protein 1, CUT1 family [Longilinea arvoryzae]
MVNSESVTPKVKLSIETIMKRASKALRPLTWISFLLPALIVYFVFMALPLVGSLKLSLYSGNGIIENTFVGLGNFRTLFGEPLWFGKLINAIRNTLILLMVHIVFQNGLGLFFAVLLTRIKKGFSFLRTAIFLPATLSVLIVGFLWRLILNPQWGAVPSLLNSIGLESWVKPWLGDPKFAMVTISLVSSWQWIGMPTMLFLAALLGIPEELLDAAKVDGASSWKTFWLIKLPLIAPVIGIYTIMTFMSNFTAFDIIYSMESSRGDPLGATDIMGTFFYRTGIGGEPFTGLVIPGLGAAIAVVIFVILLFGVIAWLYLTRKQEYEQ